MKNIFVYQNNEMKVRYLYLIPSNFGILFNLLDIFSMVSAKFYNSPM